jgi:hypothetical protein
MPTLAKAVGRLVLAGVVVAVVPGCREPALAQRVEQKTVSNDLALWAALKTAGPGTTILVQPGTYGKLDLQNRRFEGKPLRIVAAGTKRPVFEGADLSGASGIELGGLQFSSKARPVVLLQDSRDILFAGNRVTGADPDGDPWNDNTSGLHVRGSEHVTVFGNLFEDLRGASWIQRSGNVRFVRNSIFLVREGLNVAASTNLSIDANSFRDFFPNFPNKEHPDAIQFWTSRETVGSSDVRIRDNVILTGGCKSVQGIFIRSETEGRKDGGPQIRHSDFVIQRNLYYGASRNGLSVSSVDNALVENNVVVASTYGLSGTSRASVTDPKCSGSRVPGILSRFGSTTHVFNRNVTNILGQTSGEQKDNLAIGAKGNADWTDVFVVQPSGDAPRPADFLTRPGSKAQKKGIGLQQIAEHGAPSSPAAALEEGRRLHAAAAGR